jgi:(2R)-3-sulfolactate dehydrogenase (NADP+)
VTIDHLVLEPEEVLNLCQTAAQSVGASPAAARSLARATLAAEAEGLSSVGLAHFVDYLEAFSAGRIRGDAVPVVERPAPALIAVDAGGGIAQLGFEVALDQLGEIATALGIGMFLQRNAYTSGALGWFAARLAERGFVAFAATNGPPMLAGSGCRQAVFGTNPLAFGAPLPEGDMLLIDQSSSATAFVNVRRAAENGERIPDGWAIDADGEPTTDPARAMIGALLPFGGPRGGNVALIVEVLAAGLTGANWSRDAPSFSAGSESPAVGLTVIAIRPDLVAPDFSARLAAQLARLEGLGLHVPGRRKAARRHVSSREGLRVPRILYEAISAWR